MAPGSSDTNKGRHRRTTETADYMAAVARFVRGIIPRLAADPQYLVGTIETTITGRTRSIPGALDIERMSREATNMSIAMAAYRYSQDSNTGRSLGDMARIMGVSTAAVSKRAARGRTLIAAALAFGEFPTLTDGYSDICAAWETVSAAGASGAERRATNAALTRIFAMDIAASASETDYVR